MYEINKEKFGMFLVQLRKEAGLTQKELAEKLYVSDKAVSKWERGLSLPDIALLQPLADRLETSVTELLNGQRIPSDKPLTVREVEPLVSGVLSMNLVMTAQEEAEQREHRRKWSARFFLSILACVLEIFLFREAIWDAAAALSIMPPVMALIFGGYAIFLSKEKLPALYDQYQLNFVSDGMFRMDFPGVYFSNRNWLPILNAMRVWACVTLAGWVPLYYLMRRAAALVLPGRLLQAMVLLVFTLLCFLGGLFIPIAVVGRKYQ